MALHVGIEFEPTIRCCRIALFTINGIFLLLGSFCEAVGIWLQFRADKVVMKLTRWANRLYGEDPYDIPLILKQSTLLFTVVGTTAYGFALVGVAGALRRWKWVLYVYTACMAFLLLLQAGAMVLMAIHRSKFKERAHVYMMDSVYSFYRGPNAYGPSRHFSDWVDFTQGDMGCCGLFNGKDYAKFNEWNHTWLLPGTRQFHVARVPSSCCRTTAGFSMTSAGDYTTFVAHIKDPMCPVKPTPENSYIDNGCYDQVVGYFDVYVYAFLTTAITLTVLEVIACATSLAMAVRLHHFEDIHCNW